MPMCDWSSDVCSSDLSGGTCCHPADRSRGNEDIRSLDSKVPETAGRHSDQHRLQRRGDQRRGTSRRSRRSRRKAGTAYQAGEPSAFTSAVARARASESWPQ